MIIQQLSYCQFYLLKTYLNLKTTDLDLKVPGFLDYFLELVFQQVDLVDKRNSIRRRKYLLKVPQLVFVTHLKPETSRNVMSFIKGTATHAVFLFFQYKFSLFLLNNIKNRTHSYKLNNFMCNPCVCSMFSA